MGSRELCVEPCAVHCRLNLHLLLTDAPAPLPHDNQKQLHPVGCMRQVLRAGTLGRPRGMRWGGRWEGDSGWGTHVNPWLIHVNVWQKPLQYCKVISLQLIKINEKKKTASDITEHPSSHQRQNNSPVRYSINPHKIFFI